MNNTENCEEEEQIFNVTLAKCIGLYQILNPKTFRFFNFNVYHIIVVIMTFYIILVSILILENSVYYFASDLNAFSIYFSISVSCFQLSQKILTIIYNSNEIWKCLEIAKFSFISYSHHNYRSFKT